MGAGADVPGLPVGGGGHRRPRSGYNAGRKVDMEECEMSGRRAKHIRKWCAAVWEARPELRRYYMKAYGKRRAFRLFYRRAKKHYSSHGKVA